MNTDEFKAYRVDKKKVQKRKEIAFKITSIGNSTLSVKSLIILNVIIFILSYLMPSSVDTFACYNVSSPKFSFYQSFTSMFFHGGFLHLLFNMIVLWSFGNSLENIIGTKKFLLIYFISGLVSGVFWMFLGTVPAVGSSGALCGLVSAFVFVSPESTVMLFFIIPVKIKKLVYGFALFSFIFGLLSLIHPYFGFGVGHFAHLGGLIGGYLITKYWGSLKKIRTL